jgi:hypothetical protein
MANTLALDLAVVAQAALPHLAKAAPILSAVTWDASGDVAGGGDSVVCRYVASSTASIWAGTYAPSDKTATKVAVVMKEPFYNSVGFSPNEVASYNEQQMADTFIGPFIQGVIDEVADYTFRLAVPSARNGYSASAASFGFDELQLAAVPLLNSGSTNITAVLNANLEYGLNKDLSGLYGGSAVVINNDAQMYSKQVGKVTVYPYYGMPKTFAGLAGAVLSPSAVILATRVPPALTNVEQQVITDPRTGLAIAIERWTDPTLGKLIYAVKLSAGAIAGRTYQYMSLLDTDNP